MLKCSKSRSTQRASCPVLPSSSLPGHAGELGLGSPLMLERETAPNNALEVCLRHYDRR